MPDGPGPRDEAHRRGVLGATLVAGTALLAAALAVPPGSGAFLALGLATALVWVGGAVLAGPGPWVGAARPVVAVVAGALVVGVVASGAFLGARLVAGQVPVLAGSVERILGRADAGGRLAVLGLALVNGLGEELLFRGALPAAFGRRPAMWSCALYAAVTVATLNAALVAAALVMGPLWMAERNATGGVLAPVVTHVTWTTLMILLLPR